MVLKTHQVIEFPPPPFPGCAIDHFRLIATAQQVSRQIDNRLPGIVARMDWQEEVEARAVEAQDECYTREINRPI